MRYETHRGNVSQPLISRLYDSFVPHSDLKLIQKNSSRRQIFNHEIRSRRIYIPRKVKSRRISRRQISFLLAFNGALDARAIAWASEPGPRKGRKVYTQDENEARTDVREERGMSKGWVERAV